MSEAKLTKRQQKLEAGRVADIGVAEAMANLAHRLFGSWADYAKQSLPAPKWIRTQGGWMRVDRGTGYIKPGTAAQKAEEMRAIKTGG